MKEEWKAVSGFEGRYEVSNLGRVRGLVSNYNGKAKTILKSHILREGDNKGYCRVILLDDSGKRYSKSVHRLVAAAFIGDCTNFEINHKDGNKKNNKVSNLEICDKSYNTKHAYKLGLMKPCNNGLWKKINVFKNGIFVGSYESIRGLSREMNLDRRAIHRVLNGIWKSYQGLTFSLV